MNKSPLIGNRVMWPKRGVASLEEFEAPRPNHNQVLVRTRATLISPGSERAFFLGLPNTWATFPSPGIGYNNVGEVIEIGSEVEGIQVGTRVVCDAGHASHYVVAASDCLAIPDNVADEDAVFFMMATVGLQAIRKARLELGESVVVIGAGIIGLMAAQLAKLQGGLPVVCIDQAKERLAFARAVGVDETLVAGNAVPQQVTELCKSSGADVVIEATGFPQPIIEAFQMAGRGGRVVLLGSPRGETERVNFYRDVHHKGITIYGANNGARPERDSAPHWWSLIDDEKVVLELLSRKRLVTQPLITHRYSWRESVQAFELLAQGSIDAMGMVLNWVD